MPDAIALLSGGLDSAVSLSIALRKGIKVKEAVTFDYGQKAVRQEIRCARRICRKYHIRHQVFDIRWLGRLSPNALIDRNKSLPSPRPGSAITKEISRQVWIPNRNALFINIAAAMAEARGYQHIITGFNLEEARNFPDNSIDFINAINITLRYSTLNKVKVVSFTGRMDKKAIMRRARMLKINLSDTWSCYQGGRKPCGRCESCLRRG
ncbi:MAG: 7-cyano-7-deazaguanine synthase QueC [Candidatus Brocadiia bacterium]